MWLWCSHFFMMHMFYMVKRFEAIIDQFLCSTLNILASFELQNIFIHVFSGPATAPTQKTERRKCKTKISKEYHHLSCHLLYIILSAGDNKRSHFIFNKHFVF